MAFYCALVERRRGGRPGALERGLSGCASVSVSYVPKPGEEKRMLGKRLKPLTFFIQGVFMVTILLVRAKPRYIGHINFWSMYNMQRFHLFPILSRQDLNHSCLSDHSILYGMYFRQLPVID